MRIEHAIRQYALEDTAISSLVGTRWYPLVVRQDSAFPAVSYARISTPRIRSHDGPSRLASPRFQIDSWTDRKAGQTADDCWELAHAIRKRLDGFSGLMVAIHVGSIALDDERYLFEDEVKLWRVSQDFIVWHREEF